MRFIELSQNDTIEMIARKMNTNMRQLFGLIGIEQHDQSIDIDNRIDNINNRINNISYASSPQVGGNADKSNSILYGQVDPTSTAKVFTATVPGLTELVDGTCIMLKNGVVTSASGFTINVNGLGAKPCYTNMAAATRDTTIFNVAYTMLFIYDSTRVDGGCWICYRGYNSDNNTLGYLLRTNYTVLPASDDVYRYRLLFTSADGTMLVPANTSNSTNATAMRATNQRPIDPFGPILYWSGTGHVLPGASNFGATTLWEQQNTTLGFSFNNVGTALSLTFPAPVYLQCQPQSDGSAIMEYFTQSLPTTDDGKIYILLGKASNVTTMELIMNHPVYEHRNGRLIIHNADCPPIGAYMLGSSPSYPGSTWTQNDTITTDGGNVIPVWERTA